MKSPKPEKRHPAAKVGKPVVEEKTLPASKPPRVAFPKKQQPPTAAAFAARLPLSLGKRFEMARSFLLRQKDIKEDVYFYGPKTGWARGAAGAAATGGSDARLWPARAMAATSMCSTRFD